MHKWYYFAMLHKLQDIPHQKGLNVDSAMDEIPWNDPEPPIPVSKTGHAFKLTETTMELIVHRHGCFQH